MITRLTGKLLDCTPTEVTVDVHGVGYAVTIPMSTFDRLPRPGQEVVIHTHFQVREDAQVLYGFATLGERQLFRLLMTVNGVGPKIALNVLSCMPAGTFCQVVAGGDVKALSRVSGIGKKTAERLVLELKDKVDDIVPGAGLAAGAPGTAKAASRDVQDAVAALETLGFKGDLAHKTVAQICAQLPASEQTAENLIRRALQALNT